MTHGAGDRLVEHLAELPVLPATFNPYRDRCPIYDLPDAAARRRRNLASLLHEASCRDGIDVWIGREPGYLGARRTGVALTDERHLTGYGRLMGVPLSRATHTDARRPEPTARAVGAALAEVDEPVFLWNVCPLHTHKTGDPLSNSEHSPAAANMSRPVLERILELIRPRRVVALGERSHAELRRLGIPSTVVTHPAAWGTKRQEFIVQIRKLYKPELAG